MTHSEAANHVTATDSLSHHEARNTWAIAGDMVLFITGVTFISQTVVLPSFVAGLTDSETIVGLAGGLTSGGWLLPQLLVASQLARVPRKKDLLVRSALLGRTFLFLVALAIWLLGWQHPPIALVIGLAGVFVFFCMDGVSTVAWYDLLARVIPERRRGRLLGISQFVGGLGAVGAGIAVRFILSEGSPWAFPDNYALLFGLASITLLVGVAFLNRIREPESQPADKEVASSRRVLALLLTTLDRDRPFLRLVTVRLLNGCISVASVFYILYATRNLGLDMDAAGLFVSAQVVGSLAAGLLTGTVQDRWGPIVHMRATAGMSAIPPVIALCAGRLSGILGQQVLYPYLLVYFFLGISMGSMGWPYVNWIIEYADEVKRPLYIGALNTLGALTMLAPVLGGWVVRSVSYSAVFVLAVVFALSSLVVSLPLPNPRRGQVNG